jgi:hypothetical protein
MSIQHSSRRDGLRAAHESEEFGDLIYAQVKNAPWVGLSLLAHGVVFGILAMWPSDAADDGRAEHMIAMSQNDDKVVLEEEEPPDVPENRPVEEPDRVQDDVVLDEAKLDDHVETDDDQPTEESLGEPDQFARSPFDSASNNALIGIGGNAGGAFGGRSGGHRNLNAGTGGRRHEVVVESALE